MDRLSERLLRFLYGWWVPRPVRNALRLQFELLRRERVPAVLDPPKASKVLVLAPHMDDEVFGCGGTIAKCTAGGAEVIVAYVTDGSKGYVPEPTKQRPASEVLAAEARLVERRKKEARRAGKILGLSEPIFLDLPDGAVDVTPDAVARLAEVLRRVDPGMVFLPFLTDLHHDHWMTNCLFVEAAQRARLDQTMPCWGYEVWTPLAANTIVDIADTINAKRQAMSEFVSQIAAYDYPRAILGLNAYRSLLGGEGRGFGEAFYVVDFTLYRGFYEAVVVGRRRLATGNTARTRCPGPTYGLPPRR